MFAFDTTSTTTITKRTTTKSRDPEVPQGNSNNTRPAIKLYE